MSAATATNPVTPPGHSNARVYGGIASNPDIPVAGMEPWRREAIDKVIGFSELAPNWDGHGSRAPCLAVRQTALELLRNVPSVGFSAPRVVPVSGGGYHFEWSLGNREVEISIEPDCRIETLQVEDGMPIEDDALTDLRALFAWLASR